MINQLHNTQSIVAEDNHDYRVVDCGRQWGKTTLSVEEIKACGYFKKVIPTVSHNEIAYFAPTFDQARNIAWAMLKESTKPAWDRIPNESRLELWLKTKHKELSRITLRGFENIETARGQQFDFLVIDEVAQLRNWKYAWEAILEPTLAFRKGKVLFISTPRGYNHFYDMFERGQVENPYWKSWRFTSYDNPHLPKEKIDQARVNSSEDYFAQEYLADFRKFTGLAHKEWNRDINLIEPFEIPSTWQRGRGFDYGSAHYTGSPKIAIDPDDNWFVESSYLDNQRNIEQHAQAILADDYGQGTVISFGDPSGAQWFIEFAKYNLHIQPANKEVGQGSKGWVEYCVEKVNERLKPIPGHTVILPNGVKIENAPRLFVLNNPSNQPFVKQIENLKWRETATGNILAVLDEDGDPTGGHYDLMAGLRYFAVSYVKTNKETIQAVKQRNISTQRKWGIV